MKAVDLDSDEKFEKAQDELKGICNKLGLQKSYVFKATKELSAFDGDSRLNTKYAIEFTSKDMPSSSFKAMNELEKQVAKTKYQNNVLIDPGYVPDINQEFETFEAKRFKLNMTAQITKKKCKDHLPSDAYSCHLLYRHNREPDPRCGRFLIICRQKPLSAPLSNQYDLSRPRTNGAHSRPAQPLRAESSVLVSCAFYRRDPLRVQLRRARKCDTIRPTRKSSFLGKYIGRVFPSAVRPGDRQRRQQIKEYFPNQLVKLLEIH